MKNTPPAPLRITPLGGGRQQQPGKSGSALALRQGPSLAMCLAVQGVLS